MTSTIEKHIAAIKAGTVDKTTVTGLRKALNATQRQYLGWSVGRTTATLTAAQAAFVDDTLPQLKPLVTGALHDSGKAMLQKPRYRKQLAGYLRIVADIVAFRLIGFEFIGQQGQYAIPVYRAYDSKGHSFPFMVVPWQSGGKGPEVMHPARW